MAGAVRPNHRATESSCHPNRRGSVPQLPGRALRHSCDPRLRALPPPLRWHRSCRHIQLAPAIMNFDPSEGVEGGAVQPTLARLFDKPSGQQFQESTPQGVLRLPPASPHHRPCGGKVAVVATPKLRAQVQQQRPRLERESNERWRVQDGRSYAEVRPVVPAILELVAPAPAHVSARESARTVVATPLPLSWSEMAACARSGRLLNRNPRPSSRQPAATSSTKGRQ